MAGPTAGEVLARRGSWVSVENDEGERERGKGTSLLTKKVRRPTMAWRPGASGGGTCARAERCGVCTGAEKGEAGVLAWLK
jgi:hypothetical protein